MDDGDDKPGNSPECRENSTQPIAIQFDAAVFSVEEVLRAAYWLDNIASFDVAVPSPGIVLVSIYPRTASDTSEIGEALRSRVIDEHVRAKVRAETSEVRELILAKAFAVGGLLDDAPPGDDRDPVEAGEGRAPRLSKDRDR